MAKVAAAGLEEALRRRGIDANENELTLPSDNGLEFGAKPFVRIVNCYGLDQEYITPYTRAERNDRAVDGQVPRGATALGPGLPHAE